MRRRHCRRPSFSVPVAAAEAELGGCSFSSLSVSGSRRLGDVSKRDGNGSGAFLYCGSTRSRPAIEKHILDPLYIKKTFYAYWGLWRCRLAEARGSPDVDKHG